LLDLSRITSGKLLLRFEVLDLNDLVGHACDMCRSNLREKGIRLHCDMGENISAVVGDSARLQQVFWNLLNNAAKFTPAGGDIYVKTENIGENIGDAGQGGRVRVTVRDTGIGIPPEILPRIFNAFEQGDAQITRQFGGMGLGLAISRLLIEQHGGSIRAETAGPNKGSTFVVELPARSQKQIAQATAKLLSSAAGKVAGLRVLVVEDHADTAKILKQLLAASGHAVKTAATAAIALALASEQVFDLVISDLGLPDMTGYELMKQMKERHGTKGIAISGYGTEEDIRKSEQAGFSEHLVKPVNFAQLQQAIRRVIGNRDSSK
ncbi:MAG TPA: ATP-binding protein, partial [Tepidisphaeraceae bacterium]|nr:ATP-binding protein [Tepidisphaeraceae bacterium]